LDIPRPGFVTERPGPSPAAGKARRSTRAPPTWSTVGRREAGPGQAAPWRGPEGIVSDL